MKEKAEKCGVGGGGKNWLYELSKWGWKWTEVDLHGY